MTTLYALFDGKPSDTRNLVALEKDAARIPGIAQEYAALRPDVELYFARLVDVAPMRRVPAHFAIPMLEAAPTASPRRARAGVPNTAEVVYQAIVDGAGSMSEVVGKTALSSWQVRRALAELRGEGRVRQVGEKRTARYEIATGNGVGMEG